MPCASSLLALTCGLLCAPPAAGVIMSSEADLQEGADMAEAEGLQMGELLSRVRLDSLPPAFGRSRLRILADLQEGRNASYHEEDGGYDCDARPYMCKAPFNCDQWTHQDTLEVRQRGLATADQHANLRTWCMPGLERYASSVVKECLADRDFVQSAKASYFRSYADLASQLDASYCFAEGHCTYKEESASPSLDDMERMCDHRFGGRKGWTKNFLSSLKRLMDMPGVFSGLVSRDSGIQTQRITRVLSKMACAQGIFHCDVQYCKRTYCRDAYYVKKYEHLLPKVRGDLIEDPDLSKETLASAKHHRFR